MVLFRKKKKMTQAEIAQAVGCSRSTIAQYENGTRFPDREIMPSLCRVYKVKPTKFYEESTTDVGMEDAPASGV
jgi:transcriptional regulator with XRE-family HTH domain